MIDFRGKTALVTGGSRGIGRACALELARGGCDVAISYRTSQSKADEVVGQAIALGVSAWAYPVDLADVAKARGLCADVLQDLGGIDVLINCAGITDVTPLLELEPDAWDHLFDINLRGLFFCAQPVLAHMQERGSGSVVNISSTAGVVGGYFVAAHYSASKAGIICLTKTMAKQFASSGVRVNSLAPGLIETDMIEAFPEQQVKKLVSAIPLERLGTAEEVANAAVFLASDAASYITGETLFVNGGVFMG